MPERLTVWSPAFSLRVTLASALSAGAWLTGLTMTVKERETALLLVPPSLTVTVIVWASLAAPEEIPDRLTVWSPAFSLRVTSVRVLSVGAWLTGLTMTVKERETTLLLVPPSLTVTVIVAEPK